MVFWVAGLLLLAGTAFAQDGLTRGDSVQLVDLRIRLFAEDGRTPLSNLRAMVQLTDRFGSVEAESPTYDGSAIFRTTPGIHGIHVRGGSYREYRGEIEIDPGENEHTEVVSLSLLLDGSSSAPNSVVVAGAAGAPPVSVVRLKVPGRAEKEFKRGADQLDAHNFAEARKHFEAAVAAYPDYDLAYNGIGVAAQALGDVEAAQRAFEGAVARNDHFAMAWRNLAKIHLLHRDWAKADVVLQKSLRDEPVNAWALTNAAWAELENHQIEQAVATALRVHSLPHADFANAHYIAAMGLEQQNKLHDALVQYEMYLKEAPQGPAAVYARESVGRLTTAAASMHP